MISSCFKLQSPTLLVCFFTLTPEKLLLSKSNLHQHHSCAGHPTHHGQAVFESKTGTRKAVAPLTRSGATVGSPLCAWSLHCPICLCSTCYIEVLRVLSWERKVKTGKWKRLTLYRSFLFPHHLRGWLWKRRYPTDRSAIPG